MSTLIIWNNNIYNVYVNNYFFLELILICNFVLVILLLCHLQTS